MQKGFSDFVGEIRVTQGHGLVEQPLHPEADIIVVSVTARDPASSLRRGRAHLWWELQHETPGSTVSFNLTNWAGPRLMRDPVSTKKGKVAPGGLCLRSTSGLHMHTHVPYHTPAHPTQTHTHAHPTHTQTHTHHIHTCTHSVVSLCSITNLTELLSQQNLWDNLHTWVRGP